MSRPWRSYKQSNLSLADAKYAERRKKNTRELDYGDRNISKYYPIRSTGLQLGRNRRESGNCQNTNPIVCRPDPCTAVTQQPGNFRLYLHNIHLDPTGTLRARRRYPRIGSRTLRHRDRPTHCGNRWLTVQLMLANETFDCRWNLVTNALASLDTLPQIVGADFDQRRGHLRFDNFT